MRVRLVLSEALTGLRRNASMVISVVLVTFVSLTFVGAAILMQMQIGTMRDFWVDRAQVAIYMCTANSQTATCTDGVATEEQLAAVKEKLDGQALAPLIRDVRFADRDEAYQDVIDLLGEDYAGVITPEQLPETYWVNLVDQSQSDVIVEAFTRHAGRRAGQGSARVSPTAVLRADRGDLHRRRSRGADAHRGGAADRDDDPALRLCATA